MTDRAADTLVDCFVCGKPMKRVNNNEMQPWGGVYCETSGNFGSTVIDCERTAFLICDECLAEALLRTRRVFVKQERPVFVYRPWEREQHVG